MGQDLVAGGFRRGEVDGQMGQMGEKKVEIVTKAGG